MFYVLCFSFLNSFVLSNSDPLNEQSVNVALDTILEFDPKSLEHDVKLIDNMQDFLAKVKGALNDTIKHEKAEADDSRRNMRVRLSFTEFLERALRELVQFDDWLLESFVDAFHAEARRYHYKGCKFQELMHAPATRVAVSTALHMMTTHTPQHLKQILITWHNKFKMENFTKYERDLFDFLNNLYKTNDSRAMSRALENLEDYNDQSITNVTREQIAYTIREALKIIIFDHYSSLDYDARKELNIRIAKYFSKQDSDTWSYELDEIFETSEKSNQGKESSAMLDTTTTGIFRQKNNKVLSNSDIIRELGDKVRKIMGIVTLVPINKQLLQHTDQFATETKAPENTEQSEEAKEVTKKSTKKTMTKESKIIKNAKTHQKHEITTSQHINKKDRNLRTPTDIKQETKSEQINPSSNMPGHHHSESRIITGNLKQNIRFHDKDLKNAPHAESLLIFTSSTKRKRLHRNGFEKMTREPMTTSRPHKKYYLHKKHRVKNITDEETDADDDDAIKITSVDNDNDHSEKDILRIGGTKPKNLKTEKKIHTTNNQSPTTSKQNNQMENQKHKESSRGLSIEFSSGGLAHGGVELPVGSQDVRVKSVKKLDDMNSNKKSYDEFCAKVATNLEDINVSNQEFFIKKIWKLEEELEAVKEKIARRAASFNNTNNRDSEENKSNTLIINGRKFIALKNDLSNTVITTTNNPEINISVPRQHNQEDNKNVQEIINGKSNLPKQRKEVDSSVSKIDVNKKDTVGPTRSKIANNKNYTNARRMSNGDKMRRKYELPRQNQSAEDFYESNIFVQIYQGQTKTQPIC